MKQTAKQRTANRHRRVRAKVSGTEVRPRLALSRSITRFTQSLATALFLPVGALGIR